MQMMPSRDQTGTPLHFHSLEDARLRFLDKLAHSAEGRPAPVPEKPAILFEMKPPVPTGPGSRQTLSCSHPRGSGYNQSSRTPSGAAVRKPTRRGAATRDPSAAAWFINIQNIFVRPPRPPRGFRNGIKARGAHPNSTGDDRRCKRHRAAIREGALPQRCVTREGIVFAAQVVIRRLDGEA